MPIKVVAIKAEKAGSADYQDSSWKKALSDLEALLAKASRTIQILTREDESSFEFIAAVDVPEEEKPQVREEKSSTHSGKETPKKERK